MKKWVTALTLLCTLSALLLGATVHAQDDMSMPAFSDLEPGVWTQIETGGDTRCLYDTDYSFFVRPAPEPTNNLMIFYQGGGACWDYGTCGAVGQFASQYDVSADDTVGLDSGLFDYANPDNPVANYDTVFVPYCTGDVHSGDAVVTFEADSDDMEDVTAYFKGFVNSQTVLAWVFENFAEPNQIFVTGSSAGGYGATTASPFIMNQYRDTPVIHMADAANGVTPPAWEGLVTWGFFDWLATADFLPELAALTPDTFTMTALYSELTSSYPQNSFAQFNTFLDQVQVAFYGFQTGRNVTEGEAVFIEVAGEWSRQLIVNLVNINSRAPNFAYYTAGGLRHTINHVDQFYTYEYDGVTVADWVTGLLAGEQGQDVFCSLGDECLAAPPGEDIAGEG